MIKLSLLATIYTIITCVVIWVILYFGIKFPDLIYPAMVIIAVVSMIWTFFFSILEKYYK